MASQRAMGTPQRGAQEIERVNRLIESKLEGNGRLAVAYPYPSDVYRFVLLREAFGGALGKEPEPLTQEEALIQIKLAGVVTTRGTARKHSLEVLTLLADSMTQCPDENGEVDQSITEQWLTDWLKLTTPAIDPPFTPTNPITTLPRISSPQHPLPPRPTEGAMDALSEAGGVSLGPQSPRPYLRPRQLSTSTSASGKVQYENIGLAEQSIDMDEPHSSHLAAQSPMPTSQQVSSNDQASHAAQPPNIFAPQPLSMQQPVFSNMQAPGPSSILPGPPAAAPSYIPVPYAPIGWTNPSYHQPMAYSQAAPPFPSYGQAAPPFPSYGQAAPPFHPYGPAAPPLHTRGQAAPQVHTHGPWMYPVQPSYPSAYGPMLPMAPTQQLGSSPQRFPLAGQHPVYVPHSVLRNPEMVAPPLPATPVQSRTTLPPAERRATTSAWAMPKNFNIAEWAQENRPTTPATTSAPGPVVQPQHTSTNPTSLMPTMRYRYGTARMYPVSAKGAVSHSLRILTSKGTPTFSEASTPNVFPFQDTSMYEGPPRWGVVQIGNIPYSMQRMEMYEFLGPNAQVLTNTMGWPIHIILDRLTGKTMDCYVEFLSVKDAQDFVVSRNRPGYFNRLGDRTATVALSTQDALLEQIFARATNIEWRDGVPVIKESTDPFDTGFKGFLSAEELVRLIQHAEFPHRSGYTSKNLQRPYECMISILYKFPWYAPETYTIGQRNQLYTATNDLIRILLGHIQRKTHPYLHQTILEELLYAGLNAAGFSEHQRWQLCKTADQIGRAIRISPLAKDWPFEILSRKLDVPEDLMAYYVDRLTLHLDRPGVKPTLNPFRTFLLPPTKGDRFEATAKQQGELELNYVLDIYRMTLPKEEEGAEGPSGVQGSHSG